MTGPDANPTPPVDPYSGPLKEGMYYALFEQTLEEASGSLPGGAALRRRLAAALRGALAEYLATMSVTSTERVDPDELAPRVLHCLGLVSEDGSEGPLWHALAREVVDAIYDHAQQSPPRGMTGIPRASVDGEAVIERARVGLGLEELTPAVPLDGGKSGSVVYQVYYRGGASGAMRLGVLKCTTKEADHTRELEGQHAAERSWMSQWVQGGVSPVTFEVSASGATPQAWYATLSPLAYPPRPNRLTVPTLHEVLAQRRAMAAEPVIDALGEAFAREYGRAKAAPRTCPAFLNEVVERVDRARRAALWDKSIVWVCAGLPGPRPRSFVDGAELLWNPLHLLNDPSWSHNGVQAQILFRSTFQHGDLNLRNILVPIEPGAGLPRPFQIIDFEKASNGPALLDLCKVAVSVMRSCHTSAATTRSSSELGLAIADAVMRATAVPDAPDMGEYEMGLRLVRRLVAPLHRSTPELGDGAESHLLGNNIAVVLAGVALLEAFYVLSSPAHAEPTERSWARIAFNVAARALDRIQQVRPDPPPNVISSVVAALGRGR